MGNDDYCGTCYGRGTQTVGRYDAEGQPITVDVPCSDCNGTGKR